MAVLGPLELVYVLVSVALTMAGLTMVGLAIRAFAETRKREMLYLAIGFSLVVAAAIGTTISAFLADFANALSLLTVHNGVATLGYLFIIYSVFGPSSR